MFQHKVLGLIVREVQPTLLVFFLLSRLLLVNITNGFQSDTRADEKREPGASRTGPEQSWRGPKSYCLVKSNGSA